MALDLDHPALADSASRLSAYGRWLLTEAGRYAAAIHADEVGVEHLVCRVLVEEDSAAHRVCLHAFADPESIFEECLALAEGILVVGSEHALPFSPRAVDVLHAARRAAAEAAAPEVSTARLARAALEALAPAGRERLASAGLREPEPREPAAPDGVRDEGPLFQRFSNPAKQALSRAARLAGREGEPAVATAHLLLGCLQVDRDLARGAGLSFERASLALRDHTAEVDPPPERVLPPDAVLVALLGGLPPGAGSLAILAACHGPRTAELARVLGRHKVTPALLERSAEVFRDPEPGAGA